MYNKLMSLPAELWNLRALERLNLSFNQLTSLPAELGGLTALKVGTDGLFSASYSY
jgi:Leucine-rich repeat (LRR) protein